MNDPVLGLYKSVRTREYSPESPNSFFSLIYTPCRQSWTRASWRSARRRRNSLAAKVANKETGIRSWQAFYCLLLFPSNFCSNCHTNCCFSLLYSARCQKTVNHDVYACHPFIEAARGWALVELIHLRDTKQQIILRAWPKVVIPKLSCMCAGFCVCSAPPLGLIPPKVYALCLRALSLSVPFQFAEMSQK